MIYYLTDGVIYYAKGGPNKRCTSEFKKQVIETIMKERLSYSEGARKFKDAEKSSRYLNFEVDFKASRG